MKLVKGFVTVFLLLFFVNSGQASTLTTTYTGGNSHDGVMFDIEAYNDITVNHLDSNFNTGTVEQIDIYYRLGGYSGYESNQSAWTLAGSAFNTIAVEGNPTYVPITLDLDIMTGEIYGFYLTAHNNPNSEYTDGNTEGTLYTSNSDLGIYEGIGIAYSFGETFSPRVWNGTVHYSLKETPIPEPSTMLLFGIGLLGITGANRKKNRLFKNFV